MTSRHPADKGVVGGAATGGDVVPAAPGPGDLQRRWALVLPHRGDLIASARRRGLTREDAEDVVSTAMLRTVEHPSLDEARVGAFLQSTVSRLAADLHRDNARRAAATARDAARAVAPTPVDERICDRDEARWLAEQLDRLPKRERQVLQARLAGLTPEQTREAMGVSSKAAEKAYTRLRQRARAALASTLAGAGVLAAGGRRLARPEVALVPLAATTFVLGVAELQQPVQADPPPPQRIVLEGNGTPAADGSGSSPEVGGTPPAAAAPSRSVPAPPTGRAHAAGRPEEGTKTTRVVTVAPPPEVQDAPVTVGGAYVERRDTGRTFEEEVKYCLDNVDVAKPLDDPCSPSDEDSTNR